MSAASPVAGDVAAAAGRVAASPTRHRIRHHPPGHRQGHTPPRLSAAALVPAAEASVADNFEEHDARGGGYSRAQGIGRAMFCRKSGEL